MTKICITYYLLSILVIPKNRKCEGLKLIFDGFSFSFVKFSAKSLFKKPTPPPAPTQPQPATNIISGSSYSIQRDADGAITIIAKARNPKDLRRLLRNLNEAIEEVIGKGKKIEDEEV